MEVKTYETGLVLQRVIQPRLIGPRAQPCVAALFSSDIHCKSDNLYSPSIKRSLLISPPSSRLIIMRPSILLTLLFAGSASGQGACDNVECHQGAPCVSGEADFSNHSSYGDGSILEMHHVTHIQNVHCECPHGWTGVTCNRIYNSCDGDHKCYNGGNVSNYISRFALS